MDVTGNHERRRFVGLLSRAALALAVVPAQALASTARFVFRHPEPRADVDGSKVLPSDQVLPHVAELFDGIREIPHIADGIGCHCGCSFLPEMRSLLSCYEGAGMAQGCQICEGEGRIAVRMAGEGATLDEIRAAIDARFG